jgi:carbon storage regulator
MLVLSRLRGEKIVIGDSITITVYQIDRNKVRLGIEAPKDVPVHRQEVHEEIVRERRAPAPES